MKTSAKPTTRLRIGKLLRPRTVTTRNVVVQENFPCCTAAVYPRLSTSSVARKPFGGDTKEFNNVVESTLGRVVPRKQTGSTREFPKMSAHSRGAYNFRFLLSQCVRAHCCANRPGKREFAAARAFASFRPADVTKQGLCIAIHVRGRALRRCIGAQGVDSFRHARVPFNDVPRALRVQTESR